MPLLHVVLLVSLQVFCTRAWVSHKCLLLYEDILYKTDAIHFFRNCPRRNATVVCSDVSDIKLDLSAIMVDMEILCLWISNGTSLQPATFTKFHSLGSLYIDGCLSAIHPEAFRGLTNLHLLSMTCTERCNPSVPSKVFHDLYNLEELKLENYVLSEMAADVFDGLSQMKRFGVKGDMNFSDLLCKLSYFSASLEYLSIEMHVETLTTPNCSYGPIQFPSLRNVTFSFPHVKRIERSAFKAIVKVSLLSMPMSDVLHAQLAHSGIQQIEEMNLYLTEMNIQSICELALALSVTTIHLHFNTLQEYSELSWGKCYKLERLTLEGHNLTNIDLSFMSTLKNVVVFNINLYGERTPLEDESLMTLCTRHVPLTQLKHFAYSTQQYLILRAKQLACLSQLESMVLNGKLTRIERFAFEGLGNVQHLHIWRVPSSEVLHTKTENVVHNPTILDMSNPNYIHVTIENDAFHGLSGLRVLVLQIHILVINTRCFSGLENLLDLELFSCRIQTIEDFAFAKLKQLKRITLKENEILKISRNTFNGLQNLETLILDKNHLQDLEDECFAHLPSLRILHLGNLKLPHTEPFGMQVLNLSLIFGGFPRNLSELTITSAVRPMTLVIADDSAPDVGLSLTLSSEKIVLRGCETRFLKSVVRLEVSANQFLCARDLTVALQHFTSVTHLNFGQWTTASTQDLSGLNKLVHLESLKLAHVDFYNQPGFSVMFHGLMKLESLGLFNCLVDSLDRVISVDMRSLEYLCLFISSETTLSKHFFEPLHSLRFVALFDPRLICNCENSWFNSWAEQEAPIGVFVASKQQRALQCLNGDRLQDLEQYGLAHCRLEVGSQLFLSTTGLLLLFILTVLVYHLRSNTRGRYYQYDVFVSHADKDERWVMEELLPNLERRGPPFLKLCLHSRDFQLGKDIVENITDSLYRSRRTLCLVSRHYLRSNWCSLEMRLGTYRLQVEHRDVLILVFLEKIPSNLLSAHHRLARLVKTRTYIEWPQDPAQQGAFWDTLWDKLVPEVSQ
ncbi:toll-like receptor 13 [Sardina pilchardus]|uniref:toll-like receptor 13 n=1 Tax=Sardina pilchardus TaxID=27697 RepID=UPI002E0F93D9